MFVRAQAQLQFNLANELRVSCKQAVVGLGVHVTLIKLGCQMDWTCQLSGNSSTKDPPLGLQGALLGG